MELQWAGCWVPFEAAVKAGLWVDQWDGLKVGQTAHLRAPCWVFHWANL